MGRDLWTDKDIHNESADDYMDLLDSNDLLMSWESLDEDDDQEFHVDNVSDALVICLNTRGCVDIKYIASITGRTDAEVIESLQGAIYQNPLTYDNCYYKGWETAEEYLSGNLKRKWKQAKEANTYGLFTNNIKAIKKLLPSQVSSQDIYITLGSPWIPVDIISEFIFYLLNINSYFFSNVIHDEITGTWEITEKSSYKYNMNASTVYGTERMNAINIIEKTLNMKSVCVMDEVPTADRQSTKRVINRSETVAAIEKQKIIINEFRKWIWKDNARKERLERIYDEKYGCVRQRNFDGSFLKFPTMSDKIELYPYQKNAIARILFSNNTLLAHDVGSGKTYVMIAAGQELRRMGLSKKNMYVVPNNIVGQWRDIFMSMYPKAKLLCVDPKAFRPNKRKSVVTSMKDDEYDAIIIAYSCFEQIPLSKEYYLENLRDELKSVNKAIGEGNTTSKLRHKKEKLEKELGELSVSPDEEEDIIYFDELGITRLFVDEAHNFKNIPIETKITNVLGISAKGSKKCRDMLDKVHMIQKNNDGKGVVFATGTPITNSITDAYVMQLYLQSGELELLDLQSFDSWVGMFAEKVTEFEVDVDTSQYRLATRFAKFHNLPELTNLLSSIADFHQVEKSAGIPDFEGYKDSVISKTNDFDEYLRQISKRADDVRNGNVKRKEDNMLKITTDGRKAALDIRLVRNEAVFSYHSKVARCAENVRDIYYRSSKDNGTQVVFCDTSTPKEGFNLYSELKELLVKMDIPEEQIAFIHDAETETARNRLFAKVRKGEIRILIGSTFKLGIGVNVQDRLIAVHHLDVPWRPADMTQREGRILRQGNNNKLVHIFRYITEGSFDAYSWQLLESKQRFISGLLSGSITERSGSDIEDTVLNYAEIKALAVGNPLIKQRVEVANELTRYTLLQKKTVENRVSMEKELLELPGKIKRHKEIIKSCEADIKAYKAYCEANPKPVENSLKKQETENRKVIREKLHAALKDNVLQINEYTLMKYCGFDIVMPANMMKEKPYIWLRNNGKYYVELGEAEVGNLVRIDNFLDNFTEHLKKLKQQHKDILERRKGIERELAKNENYYDQIEGYKSLLREIDVKLGVIKDA